VSFVGVGRGVSVLIAAKQRFFISSNCLSLPPLQAHLSSHMCFINNKIEPLVIARNVLFVENLHGVALNIAHLFHDAQCPSLPLLIHLSMTSF